MRALCRHADGKPTKLVADEKGHEPYACVSCDDPFRLPADGRKRAEAAGEVIRNSERCAGIGLVSRDRRPPFQ
jgi:hypothetical protein